MSDPSDRRVLVERSVERMLLPRAKLATPEPSTTRLNRRRREWALFFVAVIAVLIPLLRIYGPREAPLEAIPIHAEADRLLRGERMDLNAATEEDLALVRGIGPALAKRIVRHRRARGPFATTLSLEAVRGIGPKKRVALEALVEVSAPR